jgi:N-acetylneuraminic acid mutarotase
MRAAGPCLDSAWLKGTVTMKARPASRMRLAAIATAGALAGGLLLPIYTGTATAAAAQAAPPNTWAGTGQMGVARSGQTATLLPDGQVLVTGGGTTNSELYNPATGKFSPTGALPVAISDATATLLRSGQVLVAGGREGNHQVANAELYNPASGTWAATGAMTRARSGQTATLLPNGQVLVAGGGCNGGGFGCDAGSFEQSQHSAELYNPATGTWTKTGFMKFPRQDFTATLLKDGQVLATGGFASCDDDFCGDNRSAELYNPATGKWSVTGPMHVAREQHTLLPDGDVLVAGGLNEGGFSGNGSSFSSAELYNPATGTWSTTASMSTTHVGGTATLLSNGWVLVAGGGNAVAEIYEPARAIWVTPGAMTTPRTGQTATLLPGGHVLVTGGDGTDGHPQTSAEVFLAGPGPLVLIAPSSIAFGGQLVGSTSAARSYTVTNVGSAALVASGTTVSGKNPSDFRVDSNCAKAPVPPGGTCRVSVRFAPTSIELRTATAAVSDNAPLSPQGSALSGFGGGPDAWIPVGPMSSPRENFSATLLKNGQVLVAGGQTTITNNLATAELYNPATHSFTPTGSLNTARSEPAATLLPNGEVLVTGGRGANFVALSSAELYNPATGTWTNTTPTNAASVGETSTLLPDGDVLVTGFGTSPAEVYNPAKATWTNTGPLASPQGFGTATLLHNGQVLAAGGDGTAAELYNPATNTWKATGSLNTARQNPTAVLLPDGEVLLTGGITPGGGSALANAELYDPSTGKWTATASMNDGRYGGTTTLLPDGTVLAAGGCTGACGHQTALTSTEIYSGGFWFPITDMTQPRVFQTATLLHSGQVLVAGGGKNFYAAGTSTAEVFTPVLMSLSPAKGAVGTKVTVTGSGFYAGETVQLFFDGLSGLGRVKTSATGSFTSTITIPTAGAGPHQIAARGRRSGGGANATFMVTG